MITYQREYINQELIVESEVLRREHNQEVKAVTNLNPDWGRYKILEDNGAFVIYGVRDDNLLIGYACFVISRDFHNLDEIQAYQDSIYVKPTYRKRGIGIKLLKYCNENVKKFGVNRVCHMVLDTMDFSKVLKYLGFKTIGTIMSKRI